MKRLLTYLPFAILLTVAIAAIVYLQRQQKELVCNEISININSDNDGNQLLVNEDVEQMLMHNGDTARKKIQNFDLYHIEQRIGENPFVYTAQGYFDMHNTLHIDVTQRVPFVRIIGQNDDYYIDTAGQLLPLSPHFAPRVLVASGEIMQGFRKNYNLLVQEQNDSVAAKPSILYDIFRLSQAIASDSLLQMSIEQMYVLPSNELLLISKIGPPKIEFGTIENYQQKLQNVKAFYQSKKSQENWDKYKSINVKYSNQVVAIK